MTHLKREYLIRKALISLCRQRVITILKPGDIWVIENSPVVSEAFGNAMSTCLMRGWVEVFRDAVPHGQLTDDGNLPDEIFTGRETIYRMTDSGWSVVNRSQTWVISTFLIALMTLLVSIF